MFQLGGLCLAIFLAVRVLPQEWTLSVALKDICGLYKYLTLIAE